MYAVIRRYNTQERSAEKIEQRVRDGFLPLISRLPGFVSYNVVRSSDGTLVSISVFETQAAAEQSTHMASEWVRDNIPSLIRNAPVILSGEVVVSGTGTASRSRGAPADQSAEHRAPLA
jgi:hypothetical protein